jgi:hypothetical protein
MQEADVKKLTKRQKMWLREMEVVLGLSMMSPDDGIEALVKLLDDNQRVFLIVAKPSEESSDILAVLAIKETRHEANRAIASYIEGAPPERRGLLDMGSVDSEGFRWTTWLVSQRQLP